MILLSVWALFSFIPIIAYKYQLSSFLFGVYTPLLLLSIPDIILCTADCCLVLRRLNWWTLLIEVRKVYTQLHLNKQGITLISKFLVLQGLIFKLNTYIFVANNVKKPPAKGTWWISNQHRVDRGKWNQSERIFLDRFKHRHLIQTHFNVNK